MKVKTCIVHQSLIFSTILSPLRQSKKSKQITEKDTGECDTFKDHT